MNDRSGNPPSRRGVDRRELFEHLVESSTDVAIFSMAIRRDHALSGSSVLR